MADSFPDLTALAAKAPYLSRSGTNLPDGPYNGGFGGLFRARDAAVWSYPGAPLDGTNLRIPRESATDVRVRAALASGEWIVWRVDATGKPEAIIPAGSPWSKRPGLPLRPQDIGSGVTQMPQGSFGYLYNLGATGFYGPGTMEGTWQAAFEAGVPHRWDGADLPDHLLLLRGTTSPANALQVGQTWVIRDRTTRYRIDAFQNQPDGSVTVSLSRIKLAVTGPNGSGVAA